MKPVYRDEKSSLKPSMIIFEFFPKLIARTLYRIRTGYFLRDFNAVSIFILTGLPLFTFGVVWTFYHWMRVIQTGQLATTGTVMIGALAVILGFQLLLEAVVLDVQNEPGRFRI